MFIFGVLGVFSFLDVIGPPFGFPVNTSLYGLEGPAAGTVAGMACSVLFLLKGVVAYGLWWEKDWAVQPGVFNALLGIIICAAITFVPLFVHPGNGFTFRLELPALVPYLVRLHQIKASS